MVYDVYFVVHEYTTLTLVKVIVRLQYTGTAYINKHWLCRRKPASGAWAACKWEAADTESCKHKHALESVSTVCLLWVPTRHTLGYSWAKPARVHGGGYSHGGGDSWAVTTPSLSSISEECKDGVIQSHSQDAPCGSQHPAHSLQTSSGFHCATLLFSAFG